MKVLVTGGTGVVGAPTVAHLLERGHSVRLLSRHAEHDVEEWPERVEAHEGSVAEAESVRGAADGCDAVVHLAGIVDEEPPELTFERVNVDGTRNIVTEARRAGVRHFVHVSSLGAERGRSAYHRSKRRSEEVVRGFNGNWIILRPGNVYGPGDDVISRFLIMVRSLPAVPVVGGGDHPFQPIAADDLGRALALSIERDDLARQTLELAGRERTCVNELLAHFERITGKSPARIPMPAWLASAGTRAASLVGIGTPVNADQITMLLEENVVPEMSPNALETVFRVTPTPLAEGLARLADSLPEQLPADGMGRLFHRRYWADITGSPHDAESLFAFFSARLALLTPDTMGVGAESGSSVALLEGETITMALPGRGSVQVRVVEATPRSAVVVTVAGHPLAGAVRFLAEARGIAVRFEIQTYDRAANPLDLITMSTLGRVLKDYTWRKTVERVVEYSGGRAADGVHREVTSLPADEAKRIEAWVEELVVRRKREERTA